MVRSTVLPLFLTVAIVASASGQSVLSMSQSTNNTTIGTGSGACGPTGLAYTVDNGYFRSYSLAGFPGPIEVVSITFGVQSVVANQPGGFPMVIRLFADPTPGAPAPYAGLSLRHYETFTLPTSGPTLVTRQMTGPAATFAAGEQLVVEVFSSDGAYSNSAFLIGSNNLGQSSPSYIRGPACASIGISDVTDLTIPLAGAFAGMHLIIDVNYAFTAPAFYPGTNEDLTLLSSIGSLLPTGGYTGQVKYATAGNPITVEVISPNGGFNFREVALIAQPFTTGFPPFPPAAPNIWMTFPGLTFLIGATPSPLGPPLLSPGGTSVSLVVPAGLAGQSVLFQGVVITYQPPLANNNLYATTDGHELRIQ